MCIKCIKHKTSHLSTDHVMWFPGVEGPWKQGDQYPNDPSVLRIPKYVPAMAYPPPLIQIFDALVLESRGHTDPYRWDHCPGLTLLSNLSAIRNTCPQPTDRVRPGGGDVRTTCNESSSEMIGACHPPLSII